MVGTNSFAARCTVPREQASSAFVKWLAAHAYTPLDLFEPSLLDDARLIYVPYFHFETQYRADYTVSVGYTRREARNVYVSVYEDGRYKQVPRTIWTNVTDWRPFSNSVSGDFAMKFADRVPEGGDFSSFVDDASWQPSELVPASSIIAGEEILDFSRSPDKAYSEVGKDALSRAISTRIREVLPGDSARDLRYQWNNNYYSWTHVYLPYWRFSWEYGGTNHTALVDGRLASRIAGRPPTDVELRRSVNENLKPLWISLGVGGVLAIALLSFAGSAAVVPWLLALIVVAVSGVGLMSYKRRHEALSSARLVRTNAADRLLLSLEQGDGSSDPDEEFANYDKKGNKPVGNKPSGDELSQLRTRHVARLKDSREAREASSENPGGSYR